MFYWDVFVGGFEILEIWCVEIFLERCIIGGGGGGDDDIWGIVFLFNVVMIFDFFLYCFKVLYFLFVKV